MRVAVTGGAGFIGSHLVDRLLQDGNERVLVLDNLSSGRREFVSHHKSDQRFEFCEVDLLDIENLKKALRDVDVVFHLAANPDARRGNIETDLDLKLETLATYNVLETMRLNGIKRIVFSSSGTIYGETPVVALKENYGPALPISLYGAGKLACEGLISAYCGTFGFQAWIYRFANIVGPRATHGVIYDFVLKLEKNPSLLEVLGDGSQSKPYVHVSRCVDGILFGFKHANAPLNVYNIGVEDSTSVTKIAEWVVGAASPGAKISYGAGNRGWPGDVPQVRFDTGKLTKLGWVAGATSDEAAKKAVLEIVAEMKNGA